MSVKNFIKVDGTQTNAFQLEAAANGVVLVNSSGALEVKNYLGVDTTVTGSQFLASGNTGLVINSDAAGSGADWKISLARPASGMTADWTMTLPVSAGTPGFVLQTDGSGNTSWVASTAGATDITVSTALAFGSTGTVSMFTLPANAVISQISCIVDTAFDGTGPTPSMSVGITGNLSKYMGSGDVNLMEAAGWQVWPNIPPDASTEALEITFTAGGGATTGAARVLVYYSIP